MATRILDPDRFILAGSIVDWTIAAKRHGADATPIAAKRKLSTSVVQLRWMLDPKLGIPSEAFQVWQRPHGVTTAPSQMVSARPHFHVASQGLSPCAMSSAQRTCSASSRKIGNRSSPRSLVSR